MPQARNSGKRRQTKTKSMETRDAFRAIGRSDNGNIYLARIHQDQFLQERALKKMWADKSRANEIRTW